MLHKVCFMVLIYFMLCRKIMPEIMLKLPSWIRLFFSAIWGNNCVGVLFFITLHFNSE